MKNYFKVLKNDINQNETGKGLVFITFISAFIMGGLFFGGWITQGSTPSSMVAFIFPSLFAVIAIIHFLLRPFVLIRMGQK